MMKFVVMLFMTLILSACGGGGGSNPPVTPPAPVPTTQRAGVEYIYWGTFNQQTAKTYQHVGGIMACGWSAPVVQEIKEAQTYGVQHATLCFDFFGDPNNRAIFSSTLDNISAAGLAYMVNRIMVGDEPDGHGYTEDQVCGVNAMMREELAKRPEYKDVKLWVNWTGTGQMLGATCHDIASINDTFSFDDYNGRDGVLYSQRFLDMKAKLRPGACLGIIAGAATGKSMGATGGSQDPAPFYNKAQADTSVCVFVVFLFGESGKSWDDKDSAARGLVDNAALLHKYCIVGKQLTYPLDFNPVCP
jgi:hypothetical protein